MAMTAEVKDELSRLVVNSVSARRAEVASLLRFAGGARGALWFSQVAPGHENSLRLRIYGETGGLDWAQEEPKNGGYWFFVEPLIEEALGQRAVYAGRAAAASTATGLARRHAAEQTKLIHEALGEDKKAVRAAIRSSLKSSGKKAA